MLDKLVDKYSTLNLKLPQLALVGAGLAYGTVVFFINPSDQKLFLDCPVLAVTGFYCPGCGGIRALHHLLHGDLVGALHYNLLLVLLAVFVAWRVADLALAKIKRRQWRGFILSPTWQISTLTFMALYTVLRNIPVYPFTLFIP